MYKVRESVVERESGGDREWNTNRNHIGVPSREADEISIIGHNNHNNVVVKTVCDNATIVYQGAHF